MRCIRELKRALFCGAAGVFWRLLPVARCPRTGPPEEELAFALFRIISQGANLSPVSFLVLHRAKRLSPCKEVYGQLSPAGADFYMLRVFVTIPGWMICMVRVWSKQSESIEDLFCLNLS